MGAVNFAMSDIYGLGAGTTETTVPEHEDQVALVDDQKATDTVNTEYTGNKWKVIFSILLILVLVIVLGGKY